MQIEAVINRKLTLIKIYNDEYEVAHCPFCGSEKIDWWTDDSNYRWTDYCVGCVECEARTGLFDTVIEAIKAWNRRAG